MCKLPNQCCLSLMTWLSSARYLISAVSWHGYHLQATWSVLSHDMAIICKLPDQWCLMTWLSILCKLTDQCCLMTWLSSASYLISAVSWHGYLSSASYLISAVSWHGCPIQATWSMLSHDMAVLCKLCDQCCLMTWLSSASCLISVVFLVVIYPVINILCNLSN